MGNDNQTQHQSRELAKALSDDDGFGGWRDDTEGEDQQLGGLIRGVKIRFTQTCVWDPTEWAVDESGLPIKLLAVKLIRVVQKWNKLKRPDETIIVEGGKPFPPYEDWNEMLPRDQWVEDAVGNPCGPWQPQSILSLLDPRTLAEATYPTNTVGGKIALGELVDKIAWFRRYKRVPGAVPTVSLSQIAMKTKYGTRDRPFFLVYEDGWRDFGGGGGDKQVAGSTQQALPRPADSVLEVKAAADITERRDPRQFIAAADLKAAGLGDTLEPLTLKEEMNDKIPF